MKTLLEVLPAIALKSQIRFSDNFMSLLLHANGFKIDVTIYVIHFVSKSDVLGWFITKNLSEAFNYSREYGKDCQVFQITEEGTVTEL